MDSKKNSYYTYHTKQKTKNRKQPKQRNNYGFFNEDELQQMKESQQQDIENYNEMWRENIDER